MTTEEEIARAFHESYERLAPEYHYRTRVESAVPWELVPANNRALMVAVVEDLLDRGVIQRPRATSDISESAIREMSQGADRT